MKAIPCAIANGLLLASLTCAVPVKSPAQGVGVGPRVGYAQPKGADSGDYLFGAALRARFLSVLGAEGSIDYRQQRLGNDALTVRSWPVMVTGLIYPLPVVYGAAGAGWYNTTLDYKDPHLSDDTRQDFGWHVGGGLEIPLGDAGALTADLRYVFLNREPSALPELVNASSDFYVVTVALLMGSL